VEEVHWLQLKIPFLEMHMVVEVIIILQFCMSHMLVDMIFSLSGRGYSIGMGNIGIVGGGGGASIVERVAGQAGLVAGGGGGGGVGGDRGKKRCNLSIFFH
jgi:hypothetical protein